MRAGDRPVVILVEDVRFAADMLRARFTAAGCDVVPAATLGEALLAWRSTRDPALVVLDLTLPDGDGLELLREIRRTETRKTTVVVHTADDEQSPRLLSASLLGAETARKGSPGVFARLLARALR